VLSSIHFQFVGIYPHIHLHTPENVASFTNNRSTNLMLMFPLICFEGAGIIEEENRVLFRNSTDKIAWAYHIY